MGNEIGEAVKAIIKRDFVVREEKLRRLKICRDCPDKLYSFGQCLECNCIMTIKTKLNNFHCPKGHW